MLNQTQMVFVLGLDSLGVQISRGNYQQIMEVSYIAQQRGVQISPKQVYYDKKMGFYSAVHRPHNLAFNETLLDDILEIENEAHELMDLRNNFRLSDKSKKKLEKLKRDIAKHGIEKLLKAA